MLGAAGSRRPRGWAEPALLGSQNPDRAWRPAQQRADSRSPGEVWVSAGCGAAPACGPARALVAAGSPSLARWSRLPRPREPASASRCRGQCGSVWAAPSAWSLTRAWGLDVEASARRSPRCLQGGRVDPSATSLAARACCRAVCLSGLGLHGVAANACPGLLVAAWGTGASAPLWPDSADPPEACSPFRAHAAGGLSVP